MFLHDRVRHREAQPGALADFLGREKRVEDLGLEILRDTRPVIVDFDDNRLARVVVPRPHDEHAAPVRRQHRLLGVDDQVEQHLLHLMRVGERGGQPRGERVNHGDVGDPLLVRPQPERLAHDLVDVDHRAGRLALAREGEHGAHDLGGPLRFAEDDLEAATDCRIERRLLREPFRPAENRGAGVVELVRDS